MPSFNNSLTGTDCSPNTFRTTISSAMDVPATASILPDVPAKKWAIAMGESLVGHTAAKQFAAQVKAKNGGEVVSEQFWPLGTTEYGSYITKIKASGADGLYIYATGADGVAFINQAEQFKLFDQVKTQVGFSTVSEGTFPALGDKALGWYNNVTYVSAFDNAEEPGVRGGVGGQAGRQALLHRRRELHRRAVPLRGRAQGRQRRSRPRSRPRWPTCRSTRSAARSR